MQPVWMLVGLVVNVCDQHLNVADWLCNVFIFQPPSGTPITGKGVVICKYPSDPTVALGYLSFAFLVVASVTGFLSLFYPYKGKSIPQAALFQNTSFVVFFNIAL